MKKYVIKILSLALDLAEDYAANTANPIDDVAVKAAAVVLRECYGISEVEK